VSKRASREPRLVTVCIKDDTCAGVFANSDRQALVRNLVARIVDEGWRDLDAIILPGGFLRYPTAMASRSPDERRRALRESAFVTPLAAAAKLLHRQGSPGCLIVFGIDGVRGAKLRKDYEGEINEEQYCAAVSVSGLEGLARKIFPSPYEVAHGFAPKLEDYDDPGRIIRLKSGRSALLCACYDMFGASSINDGLRRTRGIRYVFAGGRRVRAERSHLEEAVRAHRALLDRSKVSIGLAAIHAFPASEDGGAAAGVVMWQRHGIAACSAGLGSGYAVGAAHFWRGLPRSADKSPLAAARVPARHLTLRDRHERKAHNWMPAAHFNLNKSLVRLFH
jgi:hypothetical protein